MRNNLSVNFISISHLSSFQSVGSFRITMTETVCGFFLEPKKIRIVRFPKLAKPTGGNDLNRFKADLSFGWKYILKRKGLFNLLNFQMVINFIWSMLGALIIPMILSFTTADRLGAIITIAGTGMLSGSLLMTAWGGPKRRVWGILAFELLSGLCFILMGVRSNFWFIALGAFVAHFTITIVFGSNQALWQTKITPEHQSRVFATQQMLASAASPLVYVIAGPLAEIVFEPFLASPCELSQTLILLIGAGTGRGIGLMFLLMGLIKAVVSISGYLNPRGEESSKRIGGLGRSGVTRSAIQLMPK